MVRELMRSHYKQQRYLERVEEKFQRGEPIVKEDYDEVNDHGGDDRYINSYSNFTQAMNQQARNHTANPGYRTRFSNLRSTTNASRGNGTSGAHAQSGAGTRYYYNPVTGTVEEDHRATSTDPQNLKITNARDLMEHIAEQNAKKANQLK